MPTSSNRNRITLAAWFLFLVPAIALDDLTFPGNILLAVVLAAATKPFWMAVDLLLSIHRERKLHLSALQYLAEEREVIAARGRELVSK